MPVWRQKFMQHWKMLFNTDVPAFSQNVCPTFYATEPGGASSFGPGGGGWGALGARRGAGLQTGFGRIRRSTMVALLWH